MDRIIERKRGLQLKHIPYIAGGAFLLAMVLFSGVRRRVEEAVTPKCFEGLPITLVSAAITSLSFMGFGGIVESIFHV